MIKFTRIDDRLIHGQVVTTWVNAYKIEQIIVLNDIVSKDETQKNILMMAAPQGLRVRVFSIRKFAEIIKTNKITRNTMLLFTNSIDVLEAINLGIPITELNVGGMRYQDGRERVTKTVSVTADERAAFKEIIRKGIDVTVQMVPNDEKIKLEEEI